MLNLLCHNLGVGVRGRVKVRGALKLRLTDRSSTIDRYCSRFAVQLCKFGGSNSLNVGSNSTETVQFEIKFPRKGRQ